MNRQRTHQEYLYCPKVQKIPITHYIKSIDYTGFSRTGLWELIEKLHIPKTLHNLDIITNLLTNDFYLYEYDHYMAVAYESDMDDLWDMWYS